MPTVTLRPNATVSNTTILTGPSAHAALSDDSDSTYLESPNSGFEFRVDFGTFTLGSGRTRDVQIKVRARRPFIGSFDGDFIVFEDQLGFTTSKFQQYDIPAAWTTYTGPRIPVNWSQTQINGTRCTGYTSNFGVLFSELYVDVRYATQPTTAVSAPTGTITDTTNPKVVWAHTAGTDGGGQTRYQLRVFSSAQYSAAGFNPATSAATFSTGIVLGSASQLNTGALLDGFTYRAYVRTAQTINGSAHWAGWAFSEFTLNVDTAVPETTSITATPETDHARIRLVVVRDTTTPLWTSFDVERTDDAGVSWQRVRGATDATPFADDWIGYDYEAPNGTPVRYRVRARRFVGALEIVGAWTETASATFWTSDDVWMKDASNTTLNRSVTFWQQVPTLERKRRQGVFDVLGARAPVVVSDVLSLTSGSMMFTTDSNDELVELGRLFDRDVVLLQAPAAWGFAPRWVTFGNISEVHPSQIPTDGYRVWTAQFNEVGPPPDAGVFIVGTTYTDWFETFATYQALLDTGFTYGEFV